MIRNSVQTSWGRKGKVWAEKPHRAQGTELGSERAALRDPSVRASFLAVQQGSTKRKEQLTHLGQSRIQEKVLGRRCGP